MGKVPAQQVVDEEHGGEAVEEAAQRDGVDVARARIRESRRRRPSARCDAADDLAGREERDPGQPGPDREDRAAQARARRHREVGAVDQLVVGVLVREVEVGVLQERPHVHVVADAVAGDAAAPDVELHDGYEQQGDEHRRARAPRRPATAGPARRTSAHRERGGQQAAP